MPITFHVPGKPAKKGSLKPMIVPGQKRVFMLNMDAKAKGWTERARLLIVAAIPSQWYLESAYELGAFKVDVTFQFLRPKGHYNKKGLRPDAPTYLITRIFDIDKGQRLLGDVMSGLVYRDDSQIVTWHATKRYADTEGTYVTVTAL